MSLPGDIVARIAEDFSYAQEVEDRLKRASLSQERNRVLRCVLHLAQGNEDKLAHFLQAAAVDYRDVIYWAEYDEEDKQVRDYSHPFGGKAADV